MSFLNNILDNFESHPNRKVFVEVHANGPIEKSGRNMLELIARGRGFLFGAGIEPGQRVALLAANSARWIAADFAIIAQGAITVPLYARQEPSHLVSILRDCSPTLLIVETEALEKAIRTVHPNGCRIVRFEEFFLSSPYFAPYMERSKNEPVALIYTSGTSGEPKGVMLSGPNFDYMLPKTAAKLDKATGFRPREDRVFHYLPICFAASRIAVWSQLYRGNPVYLSMDLSRLPDEIKTVDPHYFLNVPTMLERIRGAVEKRVQESGGFAKLAYDKGIAAYTRSVRGSATALDALVLPLARKLVFAKIKASVGPSLEFLICGSAALSEETQRWFEMLGISIYQVYGLTETTGIVTMDNPRGVVKPGRVGSAIDGCETKITEEGELVCRGPNTFLGYWNRPEATSEMLRDGWLHTGDQAEIDGDGNVKIVSRLKDVLVLESGHNIAPAAIEQKLIECNCGIEQAMVVGHGRPFLAAIVTGSIGPDSIEAAREKVNATLPHYMRLRKLFPVAEAFTEQNGLLTANQKLRRKAVEKRYGEEIQGLYQ